MLSLSENTPNNNRLHTALLSTYHAHKKSSFLEFQKLNLSTGQPKVLSVLFENEGYLQKNLAKRCHVEPANMTSLLCKLEKDGLVYKKTVYISGSKRAKAVYLTEKGREFAIKINKIVDEIEEISFKGFIDTEKQLLISFLNRIQYNLENNY